MTPTPSGAPVAHPLIDSLWVGLGGFLGANARYWLGGWVVAKFGTAMPWATLTINVSGSFLLGLISTLLAERHGAPPALRLLIPIGFLGAYTTFSTFEMETWTVARTDAPRAWLYVALSVILGLAAVAAGIRLGRHLS
jgi:CrcB protein